jgi:hypothetical protein
VREVQRQHARLGIAAGERVDGIASAGAKVENSLGRESNVVEPSEQPVGDLALEHGDAVVVGGGAFEAEPGAGLVDRVHGGGFGVRHRDVQRASRKAWMA